MAVMCSSFTSTECSTVAAWPERTDPPTLKIKGAMNTLEHSPLGRFVGSGSCYVVSMVHAPGEFEEDDLPFFLVPRYTVWVTLQLLLLFRFRCPDVLDWEPLGKAGFIEELPTLSCDIRSVTQVTDWYSSERRLWVRSHPGLGSEECQ
eukprot:388889-Rhodomonas_salina.4